MAAASVFLALSSSVQASADKDLPIVSAAPVPFYPSLARAGLVQGVVVLEVVTDGNYAGQIKVVSGHPLLSLAATETIRAWSLVAQPQKTFRVTFRYGINERCKGNPTVVLHLPQTVEVCSPPNPPLG